MKKILIAILLLVAVSFKPYSHPVKIYVAYCLVYGDGITIFVEAIKAENETMARRKFNNIIKASFKAGIIIKCYTVYEIVDDKGTITKDVSNGYQQDKDNKETVSRCN